MVQCWFTRLGMSAYTSLSGTRPLLAPCPISTARTAPWWTRRLVSVKQALVCVCVCVCVCVFLADVTRETGSVWMGVVGGV